MKLHGGLSIVTVKEELLDDARLAIKDCMA